MKHYFDIEKILEQEDCDLAICIVVNTKGSTPRKSGAKMIVCKNGNTHGSIGGGEIEKKVIENAIEVLVKKEAKLFRHDLLHQHNMCCGGTMDIYIEPIMKKKKLYIFGAGHTGTALAKIAIDFDFEIFLIDDRKEYIDKFDNRWSVNKMNLSFDKALEILPFDNDTYVCILTYNHPLDRDILASCIKKTNAYIGMIGSIRKIEMTKKIFLDANICSFDKLNTIDMPIGLNINSETPEEIAISILAKIIQTKNKAKL